MSVFESNFIRRFIDYQWESNLSWGLYIQLVSHIICSILITVNIYLLDYKVGSTQGQIRFIINIATGMLILLTVLTFEAR